jgi:hypothetical protein
MYQTKYWWHWSGIVHKTSMYGQVMPLPWIEITKQMYLDFISED